MSGVASLHRVSAKPPQRPEPTLLRQALMESRQRWRQFGAMSTDLAFETDTAGRLTFIAPENVLGWSAEELLGQPATALLLDPRGGEPFDGGMQQHRRPTWLRSRMGGSVCMAVSVVPIRDAAGQVRGSRGVGVNITEQERASAASAAALRRGEVLDHILGRLRQEVLAPHMMQGMLEALMRALGAQGAAALDLLWPDDPGRRNAVLYMAGGSPAPLVSGVMAALSGGDEKTRPILLEDGTLALACPCSTRFGERVALMAWRARGSRGWDEDDMVLIGSVAGVMRMVLEHEGIQRELARQARTDPLTGLLNRRAFLEEARRRLDRLERDGQPGTLLYLDLDRLKQLNDLNGHEAGDTALVLVATLLNRVFRPMDLVARMGGDEFAIWLDGADSLTVAERAEELRLATPQELGHLVTGGGPPPGMSIGIATREAGTDETLEQMMHRADMAMYSVKRNGRGHWAVSHVGAS